MPLFGPAPQQSSVGSLQLPTAHRRPKFRLEELSRQQLLVIGVSVVLLFLVLLLTAALVQSQQDYSDGSRVPDYRLHLNHSNSPSFFFPHYTRVSEGAQVVSRRSGEVLRDDETGEPWHLGDGEVATVVRVSDDGAVTLARTPANPNASTGTAHKCEAGFFMHANESEGMPARSTYPCGDVGGCEPARRAGLRPENKRLMFRMEFTRNAHDAQFSNFRVNLTLQIETSIGVGDPMQWRTVPARLRSRTIICRRGASTCFLNQPIIHLPYIEDDTEVEVRVRVANISRTDLNVYNFLEYSIVSIQGYFDTVNKDFTLFIEVCRLVFFTVNIVVVLWFYLAILKLGYPWRAWALEQKWTLLLLITLLGFNNPIADLEFAAGMWYTLINTVLINTYLVTFLFALLAFTDNVAQTRPKPTLHFYLPKAVLLGTLWLIVVVSMGVNTYNENGDPASSSVFDIETRGVPTLKIGVGVVIGIYGVWLLWLVASILTRDVSPAAHVSLRFKVVWSLTVGMLAAIVAGILRVNLVTVSASEFVTFIGIFNIYTFCLAAFFSPATDAMPFRATVNAAQAAAKQREQRAMREYERVQLADDDGINSPHAGDREF
eukprot:TRINITY_DN2307_c0_g2_i1.p1 TRINITY_DN2307_c0_g2~~TRINITY_DN2307_c0_g2_i1.p1  ORF type:complete len:603 (+),score=220.66 TRINITY_DN2307_c0_g2_i1:158-1966(+)